MRIDLHTHSTASDGTDEPADLIRRAAAAGLDVVALTDHDSAAGSDEARSAADEVGISFVPGMEISTKYADAGVHLLAYFVDPANAALGAELDRILEARRTRLDTIVARLNEHGIELTTDDIRRQAGAARAIGRPHIADALVARGIARDRPQAFAEWLSAGRPGHVLRYAAPLPRIIQVVVAAGGVPVVAHPWGRGSRSVLDTDAFGDLVAAGLAGLEVDHQDHDETDRSRLRDIAAVHDLVITGSSDYHGTGKTAHDLGSNLTAPDQWERLRSLASGAPDVVRP